MNPPASPDPDLRRPSRDGVVAGRRWVFGALALAALATAPAGHASAAELSSASYRHRGGSVSAGAASALASPGPRFGSSGITAGAAPPVGFAGGGTDPAIAPGYWPLVLGAFPSFDVDGDDLPSYLDTDDDDDGLLDAAETGTGQFVSASDVGTSAVAADSDGDGVADGVELAQGTDPNDPESFASPIPALPLLGGGALALALAGATRLMRRRTCWE